MRFWPWHQPDAADEVIDELLTLDDGLADGYVIGAEESMDGMYYVKVVLHERTVQEIAEAVYERTR